MQLFFLLLALFFSPFVRAASQSFALELDTNEDALKAYNIYTVDNNIFIGQSVYILNGTIQDNGALKMENGSFVGISKNYLTLTNDTTEYAQPFSIDGDGYLNLYGSKDFKAIPSGSENNQYIVGSSQASTTVSGSYTVQIKAVGSDGKKASKFSVSGTSGASKFQLTWTLAFASLLTLF